MNIFVLSSDSTQAARWQCDKHLVKMVVETAQLLCAAYPKGDAPYKPTHVNHPCAVWARKTQQNFAWLAHHGMELGAEFERRFGKPHKSSEVILWCFKNRRALGLPNKKLTSFAKCVPEDLKHLPTVQAYREYYVRDKAEFATWRLPARAPYWWPFPPLPEKDKR